VVLRDFSKIKSPSTPTLHYGRGERVGMRDYLYAEFELDKVSPIKEFTVNS